MTAAPTPTDPNILDLRQVVADRAAQAEARRPRRLPGLLSRGRSTEQRSAAMHRPSRPRDWLMVRREGLKFGLALAAVAIPGIIILLVARVSMAAGDVQKIGQKGFQALQDGGAALSAWDFPKANTAFHQAANQFAAAEKSLNQATWIRATRLQHFPVYGRKLTSAASLITAGQSLAQAGIRVVASLEGTTKPDTPFQISDTGVLRGTIGFVGPLLGKTAEFKPVIGNLAEASQAVSEVHLADVPAEYRPYLQAWQELHPVFFGDDNRLATLYDVLVDIFAAPQAREYLILFQNDDELRPTGGFPGTYLLVKFQKGEFTILDAPVTGPYDLTSQNPKTVLPPTPVQAVAPYWAFQDAAWFLDVPTSSDFVLDFYEEARGFRPDGVIYVTPRLVESLLAITGPVRPPGYGLDITQDNFLRATELQVEFGYDKALNNPKQFLIDLLPVFFTKLSRLSGPQATQALVTVLKHASENDLILFSRHAEVEKHVTALGWDGAIRSADGDYVAVVNTNLGGGKTDRVIDENIRITIRPDGDRLRHEVRIHRRHKGQGGDILTGLTSRSFFRVYTPTDSLLVSIDQASVPPDDFFKPASPDTKPLEKLRKAEGRVLVSEQDKTRITEEHGLRVYGAWSIVPVGREQTMTFVYTTPRLTGKTWSLLWQKQPGTSDDQWEVRFQAPEKQQITAAEPASGELMDSQRTVRWQTEASVSQGFSASFE